MTNSYDAARLTTQDLCSTMSYIVFKNDHCEVILWLFLSV